MKKRSTRFAVIAMLAALPLVGSACKIPVGGGCSIWLLEPGVNFGLICN